MNLEIDFFELFMIWTSTFLLILVIKKFTYKYLLEYLDKREKHINSSIENAEEHEKTAAQLEQDVFKEKQSLASSREEIIESTRKLAETQKEELIGETKEQVKKILSASEEQIEVEKNKAKQELIAELMEMVTVVSGEYVSKSITPEAEMKLIKEAIAKVNIEK